MFAVFSGFLNCIKTRYWYICLVFPIFTPMILVTGATGFLGFHLLLQLQNEDKGIRALYRSESKLKSIEQLFKKENRLSYFNSIEWFQVDIMDVPRLEKAFEGITQVYHCAALVSFQPQDAKKLYKNNVLGTANVVNCCLAFRVEKLCYVSSIAALGNGNENNWIVNEDTDRNFEVYASDYSLSKYGAEQEVWRGYYEGLNVVIVNPGVIFGSGFPNEGSQLFIDKIKKGFRYFSKGKIGIIGVKDVVNCMQQLMRHSVSGQRYILVAENCTYQELFATIAEKYQVKKPNVLLNKTFAVWISRMDGVFSKLFFTKRKLMKATVLAFYNEEIYVADKIKALLNIQFKSLKEIIEDCD